MSWYSFIFYYCKYSITLLQESADKMRHLQSPLYRYCHFFSFLLSDDHSRVRLQLLDGDPHSDYINANYIDVSLLDVPTMTNAPADKSAYAFGVSYIGTDCWSDTNDSWTLYKRRVVTGRRFSVSSLFCLTGLDRWRFPMFDRSTNISGMWAEWRMQKSVSAPRNSISRYLRLIDFLQSYSAEGV